jgi:hypothetical protein
MVALDYQVAVSADDGRWVGTNFSNISTLIFGKSSGAPYYNFARFVVTIPAGAKITSAYMSFYFISYTGTPPACALHFEKSANPAAISSAVDGNNRTKTTASISLTGPTTGTWWNTGDISVIIQELVNAYSYASGAAMQMILYATGGSGDDRSTQRSYNTDPTHAPKLHIEYVTGCPRQAMHMRRLM